MMHPSFIPAFSIKYLLVDAKSQETCVTYLSRSSSILSTYLLTISGQTSILPFTNAVRCWNFCLATSNEGMLENGSFGEVIRVSEYLRAVMQSMDLRCAGVICFVLLVLHLLLIRFTSSNLRYTSSSMMKYNRNWNSDLSWFSYSYPKCTFVDSITEYIGLPDCVQCWLWSKNSIGRRRPISSITCWLFIILAGPHTNSIQGSDGEKEPNNTRILYTDFDLVRLFSVCLMENRSVELGSCRRPWLLATWRIHGSVSSAVRHWSSLQLWFLHFPTFPCARWLLWSSIRPGYPCRSLRRSIITMTSSC